MYKHHLGGCCSSQQIKTEDCLDVFLEDISHYSYEPLNVAIPEPPLDLNLDHSQQLIKSIMHYNKLKSKIVSSINLKIGSHVLKYCQTFPDQLYPKSLCTLQ